MRLPAWGSNVLAPYIVPFFTDLRYFAGLVVVVALFIWFAYRKAKRDLA
jgi:hypothetical protein